MPGDDGENFRIFLIATVNTYEKCNKTPTEHVKLNMIICPMAVFNTYPIKNYEFWLYLCDNNNLINSAVISLSVVTNQETAAETCSGTASEYRIQTAYDSHRSRCNENRMALNKRINLFLSTSDTTDQRPVSLLINKLKLITS
jgi:hypothetical protein